MPLNADIKLRFQVMDRDREAVLEKVSSWGWSPAWLSSGPRFCLDGTTPTASVYEIDLPPDRPAVVDDRSVKGEMASGELKAFRKLHGLS